MVDVNTQNKTISVNVSSSGVSSNVNANVSSSGVSSNVNASGDTTLYYSNKAREWAISNRIVDGVDYSSKYYAGRANQSASEAQDAKELVLQAKDSVIADVIQEGNIQKESLKETSEEEQETITEIKNSIEQGKAVYIGESEPLDDVFDIWLDPNDNDVSLSIEEIQEQLPNKQDKLTAGENIEIVDNVISANGGSGFNLFDTKVSDHILEGEEAVGWALQGTYVNKIDYPDFYAECIAQQTTGTSTEITLGALTVTMSVNANGHRFYNIDDKATVDTYYAETGIADFYGIDTENERIFLPRNKFFAVTGAVMGNGMTLGLTNGSQNYGLSSSANGLFGMASKYGSEVSNSGGGGDNLGNYVLGVTTDPTKSGIVLEPNENKYLYYCVGNTEVKQAISNVTEITTTENDTTPLFTGMYFYFKPNHPSWLKGGEQKNRAGIYETTYDTLVDCLNGTNPYELNVINISDMVAGVDYSEYWKLDQDNMVFQTPTAISNKALSGAVMGNGMTLGLTDGTNNYGLSANNSSVLEATTGNYGTNVGILPIATAINAKTLGVTTDPTKSGIVAEQSTAQLYFKVANAVTNLELLNVGEVMEAVNSVVPDNSSLIASYSLPDYSAGIALSNLDTYQNFDIDGFIFCAGSGVGYITDIGVSLSLDGNTTLLTVSTASTYGVGILVPLPKGYYVKRTNSNVNRMTFFPLKGVN